MVAARFRHFDLIGQPALLGFGVVAREGIVATTMSKEGPLRRATFRNLRQRHSIVSRQTRDLRQLWAALLRSSALQPRAGPGRLEERLLLAFCLFALSLWAVSAWTVQLSWPAVAVVGLATLTAGAMFRRNLPHWLAFIAVVVWGGLPFSWKSIDPNIALAFLGLLCGAICVWCPPHTNKTKIGVA